jgi:asparagine synthase (glutamine-hydrolysing)
MCGIVGIVPREPADPARLEDLVRRMARAIAHRGPDDEGFHVTPEVALGVRRLAIIDVAHGRQPMTTSSGKTIVFNGEIYNFRELRAELARAGERFRTASDTEVLLAALDRWGEAGIRRLEGMFAFAIWDAREHELVLARDWMGQKSIYHAECELGWIFASEIKALLSLDLLPRQPDLQALSHYMSLRYLPGESTLFVGIDKLPAAHRMHVTASRRRRERMWAPAYEPKLSLGEDEALDELDRLFGSVVGQHLMSEVPLGAFLSGGIDSSLVVAYAARASSEPLRTFSIGVDEASQSELPWARQVADRYRTRHFEKVVAPDLAALAPRMTAALEEPVDPFAAGVWLVSEITAGEVTVALGGDGGDELFAGYDRYVGQQLAELYARIPGSLRRGVLRPLSRLVPESFGYKSLASKLRWLDRMAERDDVERYAASAAFLRFPHEFKARIFTERVWSELARHESERLLAEYFTDGAAEAFIDKMLHADCMTRLADHQLPIVDRMSMTHSLETRSPFLDRRIVEFAARLPAAWKLKHRRLKYLTRTLGERYLPKELVWRPKQGFGFPLALWLRGELRPLAEAVTADSRLAEAGIFRREETRRLLDEHLGGRVDHNFRLWMLFNLELWYRHFIEGEDVPQLESWVERCRRGLPQAAHA